MSLQRADRSHADMVHENIGIWYLNGWRAEESFPLVCEYNGTWVGIQHCIIYGYVYKS